MTRRYSRRLGTLSMLVVATLMANSQQLAYGADASGTTPLVADTIFTNARFLTSFETAEFADSVAIRDGRILAVGSAAEIARYGGATTAAVDLAGRTVLPGFYDNHVHLGGEVDVRVQDWEHIDTKEALLNALARRAEQLPAGEWVLGTLQNENMPQAKLPTRFEMDEVTPNHPVAMRRGHITLANSRAMELAGITKDTPDPNGGSLDRNAEGVPLGWLWEGAGRRMIMDFVSPAPETPSAIAEGQLIAELQGFMEEGITNVNVAGMRPNTLRWMQNVYARRGAELPRSTVQLRLSPGYDTYDDPEEGIATAIGELESLGFVSGFGDDRMQIGAVKMSVDGGFSAAAFWTLEPHPSHADEVFYGVKRIPEDVLYRVSKRAHDLGWQLGIHAIGDGAVEMVANVYDRILTESPREDHRHYMHHVSVLPPEETIAKMAKNDIYVASQPNFTYSLGPFNASPALSPERLETNNPQKSFTDRGLQVSYGSDGMPISPLTGIYAAVTRKGVDGKVYGAQEAVPLLDAIRMYTLASAELNFVEDDRGSIEAGKLADFTVLGEDIFTVDPERIKDIPIAMTIVGGAVLYNNAATGGQ